MSLIGNVDTPESYVADYMQACVGMFGIPAGGFVSDIETFGSATSYDVESLYAAMLNSTIGRSIYAPGISNESFATKLVDKVGGGLLSDANKAAAIDEVQALLDGGVSRAATAMAVVEFVAGLETSDETFGAVAQQFQNRIEIANYYTFSSTSPSSTLSTLTSVLSGVSDTTDVSDPAEYLDSVTDPGVSTGQTYTLTTGADTGAAFTGTSGNDTFVASLNTTNTTGSTYTAGDNLNGGAGDDSLIISVTGDGTLEDFSAVTLTSIEKVTVSNFGVTTGKTAKFDLSGAQGVTTVGTENSSSTGHTQFSGLTNSVNAVMKGSGNLTVINASGQLTATDDAATLTLNGTGTSATAAPTFKMWAGAATGVVETLNIKSQTANNFLTLSGDNDHKTLNITGDKNLTLVGDVDSTTTKVDASTFTGGLSVALGNIGTPATFAFTGGTGNDTVRVDGSAVDATKHTIAGGEGTDTLQLTAATGITTAANAAAVTGFEKVEGYRNSTQTTASSLVVAQDVSLLSGVTTVGVSSWTVTDDTTDNGAGFTNADGVTFTGMGATTALAISGIKAAGDTANSDAVTLGFTAEASLKTNTTADSINVTLGTATAAATSGNAGDTVNLNLTLNDYETVTITSQGGANTVANLSSTSLKTLNLAGDKALTISGGTNGALKTIDASAATANVNITGMGKATAVTITGGAGNDTLTGSSGADSISGGAGNDNITSGGGNDTINGDAGNDTIVGDTGNEVINGGDGNDTITGGGGKDSLSGGAGDDRFIVSGNGSSALVGLSSTTTINGGDGTDVIAFTGNGDFDLAGIASSFTNVSSVEKYVFSGLADGNDTVTVDDVNVSSAGGSLTLRNESASASTFVANTLSNSSKVVFETNQATGLTYQVGNGIDQVTFGTGNDTLVVATAAYLGANDTIVGGAGTDTVKFTQDGTTDYTISAAQLATLTGFEKLTIDAAANTNAKAYIVTLTDAFLTNNNAAGVFTAERHSSDTGAFKVDASGVGASYNLELTGSSGNDTLLGGAGNDTIATGAGKNSVDGGAGDDTIVVASTQSVGSVLAGGTGTDTLKISSTSNVDISTTTISGIEKIFMNGNGAEVTIAGSVLSGSTIAVYANAANESQTINVQAVGGGTTDLSGLKFDATSTGQSGAALWNGGGTDSIKIVGSALNDVIVGSSQNDTITGGVGNDTIDLSAGGTDTVVFSDTLANNGVDTITGFKAGAAASGGDVLNFANFVTLTGVLTGTGTNLATGSTTAITAFTGGANTDIAGKVVVWNGTLEDFKTELHTATGSTAAFLASGAKAILLIGNPADGAQTLSAYLVTGGAANAETVDLVGTVGVNDGDAMLVANFGI